MKVLRDANQGEKTKDWERRKERKEREHCYIWRTCECGRLKGRQRGKGEKVVLEVISLKW